VRKGILFSCKVDESCGDIDEPNPTKQTPQSSQLVLARETIKYFYDKHLILTDNRCWMVRAADNETPYAVQFLSKYSCSCLSVRMYYHITACKLLMIGEEICDSGKNLI